jgi:hypothetical protein
MDGLLCSHHAQPRTKFLTVPQPTNSLITGRQSRRIAVINPWLPLIRINAGLAARRMFSGAEPLNFGESTAISEVLWLKAT